jgi:hypothetical protein
MRQGAGRFEAIVLARFPSIGYRKFYPPEELRSFPEIPSADTARAHDPGAARRRP